MNSEAWQAAEQAFMALPRQERRQFLLQMGTRLKNEVAMLARTTVEAEKFVLQHPEGVKTWQVANHLGCKTKEGAYSILRHVMKQWGTITRREGTWFPHEVSGAQQQQSGTGRPRKKGTELPPMLGG